MFRKIQADVQKKEYLLDRKVNEFSRRRGARRFANNRQRNSRARTVGNCCATNCAAEEIPTSPGRAGRDPRRRHGRRRRWPAGVVVSAVSARWVRRRRRASVPALGRRDGGATVVRSRSPQSQFGRSTVRMSVVTPRLHRTQSPPDLPEV